MNGNTNGNFILFFGFHSMKEVEHLYRILYDNTFEGENIESKSKERRWEVGQMRWWKNTIK